MTFPEVAEQKQRRLGQRQIAILRPLAAMNVDHHAFRVDVADLQIASFLQPQSQGVHGPEEHGHAWSRTLADDLVNLINGQNFRQRFDVFDSHLCQRLPLAFAGASVEKLHAAIGDSQRSAGELLVVLQVQEEFAKLIFGDLIGRAFAEVGKLPNGSEVAFVSPLRHAAEMQIFTHAFIKQAIEIRRMRETSHTVRGRACQFNVLFSTSVPTVLGVILIAIVAAV